MFRVVVVSCLLAAVVAGQTTDVSQCIGNPGELPKNLYLENCITPPCLLPQLQDAVINIVFRAPRTIRSMRTLATAYMAVIGTIAIPIPYNLGEQAITCNFLTNTYCPVLEDEVVLYQLNMFIESFFPVGTSVTVEFQIVDDSTGVQVPLYCVRVPIRIIEAVPALASSANATTTQH